MTGCLRHTADPMLSILVREGRILLQRLLHPQLVWEGKRPDRFFPEPWNSQKKKKKKMKFRTHPKSGCFTDPSRGWKLGRS